jgi:signal transduction histidine kinase
MKTILLLDDDQMIRSTFSMALRHHGYSVLEAASGEEGIRLAIEHLPDLIISDVSMPGAGGQAVLESIRQHPELSGKQVVLMTGQTHLLNPRLGMDLGADDFLVKPVSLSELLQCVEARLKRASTHWKVEDRMLSQLRSTLCSTLPHELFTPLGGIIGLTEVLQANLHNSSVEEMQELLKDIHSSGLLLHRTLRNYLMILDADRPQEGPPAAPETLSKEAATRALVGGIQAAVHRNLRDADVKIHLEECSILAMPGDVSVMVEEIVDNAAKFSANGSPVDVHFNTDGLLTVTDAGRGMTAEEITRVGTFRQFDRKKFEQQGLGLGLALVQKLAIKSGATLSISSKPESGTTVQIVFRKA